MVTPCALLLVGAVSSTSGSAATPRTAVEDCDATASCRIATGGAALFGAMYVLSAGWAGVLLIANANTGYDPGVKPLFIPLAGPFLALSNTDKGSSKALLVFDGVAQVGGLAMVLFSSAADPPKPSVMPAVAVGLRSVSATWTF